MPIQFPGIQKKKSMWDYASEAAQDAFAKAPSQEDAIARRLQIQALQDQNNGVISGEKFLGAADNFDFQDQAGPGTVEIKVRDGENVVSRFGVPRKKTSAMDDYIKSLTITDKNLSIADQKRKAAEHNNQRLPADKVLSVNEGNTVPGLLGDVRKTLEANTDAFGPVKGRLSSLNPYDEKAQTIDAQFRTASQAFGRFMEGGVLRKEDEAKYRKMFPELANTPEVSANKLALVERMLLDKQKSNVDALSQQGYNTAGLTRPNVVPDAPSILSAPGQAAPKESVKVVNGVNYRKVPGGWEEVE